ncbi:unnamed protein product, partial [Mesorhabditis spiculigera]
MMEALLRQLMMQAMSSHQPAVNKLDHPDTAETVNISSLPLLKMLKHARSGVPLEVMGLLLGTFVDDFTVNVVDVFAMPQSGTSVSVESVDPIYQAHMLEKLKQTGRDELVVGWYHSHPGFGCWLSDVDQQTQKSFEALHHRAIAIVVDPIQSVKGKVLLEAFRLVDLMHLNPKSLAPTGEARQTTSNLGYVDEEAAMSRKRESKKYYNLVVNYRTTEKERKMLSCLDRHSWVDGLRIGGYRKRCNANTDTLEEMTKMAGHFGKDVIEMGPSRKKKEKDEKERKKYGKLNAKQRLEMTSTKMMEDNIVQEMASVLNTSAFH